MAEIQFSEEPDYQRPVQPEEKSFFIRLVLATKIVSTDRQAEQVLLVIAVIALLISVSLFISASKNTKLIIPGNQIDAARKAFLSPAGR